MLAGLAAAGAVVVLLPLAFCCTLTDFFGILGALVF